jgi:hypothetical protein
MWKKNTSSFIFLIHKKSFRFQKFPFKKIGGLLYQLWSCQRILIVSLFVNSKHILFKLICQWCGVWTFVFNLTQLLKSAIADLAVDRSTFSYIVWLWQQTWNEERKKLIRRLSRIYVKQKALITLSFISNNTVNYAYT